MKRKLALPGALALMFVTAVASASGSDGRPCAGPFCSARKAADVERMVGTLRAKHPGNMALVDLGRKLAAASSSQAKGTATAEFFALKSAADDNDVEKAIDRRLNDGQSDKLTNAEVRALADVLSGNAE